MRSWSFKIRPKFTSSIYIPRYESKSYAPISDFTSSQYINLDLFIPCGTQRNDTNPDSLTVSLQRSAKVNLMLRADPSQFPDMTLNGWESEGWAQILAGSNQGKENLSLMGSLSFNPPNFIYVFSKIPINSQVHLPGVKFFEENS